MPADLTIGVDIPAAVLWDFDGTLVETEHHWHSAEARLMRDWGAEITPEQQLSLTGINLAAAVAALADWAGAEDADHEEAGRRLTAYMLERFGSEEIVWRPGARDLLEEIAHAGIPCAVVSASHTDILATVVDTLPGVFATVVGGNHVSFGKPHPESYLTAAGRLGVAPRDCIALEDSVSGVASAGTAGVPTLGVPFMQELPQAPGRRIVPTLEGLSLTDVGRLWRELRDA